MTLDQRALNDVLQDWGLWPILNDFDQAACDFTLLEQGLTNKNWLVTLPYTQNLIAQTTDSPIVQPLQFVIRINTENAKSLNIHHQSEYEIVEGISALNFCPTILYKDPNFKYWIRPYIRGHTLGELQTSTYDVRDDLEDIAKILSRTHKQPIQQHWPSVNTLGRTEYFWQQILPNPVISTDRILKLKELLDDALQNTEPQMVLCHMDTNIHNWIKDDNNNLNLIDWEYAGLGNPIWDLAVFSDSAELNRQEEEQFLAFYDKYSVSELRHAKLQMEYLSILWFAVQENTDNNTFTCELKNLAFRANQTF
jgi:thiamine kinase-like enzyme